MRTNKTTEPMQAIELAELGNVTGGCAACGGGAGPCLFQQQQWGPAPQSPIQPPKAG